MNTPWIKVWRDIWINRSRSLLVVLSIAVGVFALGMIAAARQALEGSLAAQYTALRPADAILLTEPALDDDFVAGVRHMRAVAAAEGRRSLALRVSLDGKGETWRDLTLYALADYTDQRLFQVWQQDGPWPPAKGEVLLERSTMAYLGLAPGDTILVKTPQGRKTTLRVAGRAHDLYRIPPIIEGWLYGYVSLDTIGWMGEAEAYNELYITARNPAEAELRALVDKVARRIEGQDLPVYQKTLPDRGRHPLDFIIQTVLILLGLLAGLAMFLSGLLVVNVISAFLTQQERQVGILKAVGARAWQIIGMYFGMVLTLGLAACLVAVPLSNLGANLLAQFVAGLINFNPPAVPFTSQSLLLQLGVGLIVPLLASAGPVFSGTRVSPARVLSEYGLQQGWRGSGAVDALLARFPRLTRDVIMAVRNPFRKRGRLALALVTLTFAGAIFMAVVNLRLSLNDSLTQMLSFWNYDAWLVLGDHYPSRRLVGEARTVVGVEQAEAWGFSLARYVRPDGTESASLYLLAPLAGTELLHPPIIAGRGLLPEDTHAILVTPGLLASEPDLHLGGDMIVKIEGREQPYRIVGVMQMMGNSTIGYFTVINYADYTRHVREGNRANAVVFTLTPRDLTAQRLTASQVESRYDRAGIDVISNFLIAEEREEVNAAFGVIVALLLVMTVLLALVGGLGLAGTMSLNVIERTREIGVMRAYGASSRVVFRAVIVEGLLIGLLSWFLALGLALPISGLLARGIGLAFIDYPMPASFSIAGAAAWIGLVVFISIVASLSPALRAVKLTVTEVLAYE